ncbi:GIY-YIG nuclease family protein [Nocardia niigatensis]|uniref:GIY-YIG nuclease family protein n=1 Tax=Nocardia niigatensis TaxID=209249 RepID=UPI000593A2D8|nr:GIY-YIG nuclease family protein [Nocardia niigatensis]
MTGDLCLGHILAATGIDLSDIAILRHTSNDDGLASPVDLTPEKVLGYTRRQLNKNSKLGKNPPRVWLVFIADGGRRSRLLAAYENHGAHPAEGTAAYRLFDLRSSDVLSALIHRLVIEWSPDAVNWAKSATTAADFPVVEIADPESVPFPGYDEVLITFDELGAVVEDSRYAAWRTALSAVQGIYLIADTTTGQLYVGKANGAERIFARWSAYARDGHGGNVALRALAGLDAGHARHFQFSILRVFGPSTPSADVDQAEAHFKRALLTRQYGLNRN